MYKLIIFCEHLYHRRCFRKISFRFFWLSDSKPGVLFSDIFLYQGLQRDAFWKPLSCTKPSKQQPLKRKPGNVLTAACAVFLCFHLVISLSSKENP